MSYSVKKAKHEHFGFSGFFHKMNGLPDSFAPQKRHSCEKAQRSRFPLQLRKKAQRGI